MATRSFSPTVASATGQASSPSLILALHARYAQSFVEYNFVDRANLKLSADDEEELLLSFRYKEAMQLMSVEAQRLQLAILYQVPTTDEELTVLAYHLWSLFDPDQDELPAEDRKAIGVGLDNLFDYLVTEGRADMQKLGRIFTSGAMLAFDRRRFRHAQLDNIDELQEDKE